MNPPLTAAATAEPLLRVETLLARHTIRIDGETFELRNQEELPLLTYRRLMRQGDRFNALLLLEVPTDEDAREVSQILEAICRAVLDAPEAVHSRLSDQQRMAVVDVFYTLRPESPRPNGAMDRDSTPIPTGSIGPPAAPDSSAATS